MTTRVDVVVIGAGHDGLVGVCYPARAGLKVPETCLAEGEQPSHEGTTYLAHLQQRFGATMPNLDPAPLQPRREDGWPRGRPDTVDG